MQTETAVGNLFSLPLTVIKQSEIHLSNTVVYKINTHNWANVPAFLFYLRKELASKITGV